MRSIVLLAIVLLLFSCSKKESTAPPIVPPKTDCRISSAYYTNGTLNFRYTLSYNDEGKISKLVYDGPSAYVKTFTYSEKLIYINIVAQGTMATDTISLNNAGLIVNHKETTPQSVYNTSFSYDSGGQVISSTTQQDDSLPVTTYYTFTNGDLTNTNSGLIKDTTVYDLGKPSVIGNLDDFNQLIYYGASYYTNKHLKQSFFSWPYQYQFSYTYDGDGKITSVVAVDGAVPESFEFTYDCK